MKNDEKHVLVKGKFQPDEAKEVLLALVNHKINFHELKNFSSMERFGKKEEHSVSRIRELKETKRQLLKLFDTAAKESKQLMIDSVIRIGTRK